MATQPVNPTPVSPVESLGAAVNELSTAVSALTSSTQRAVAALSAQTVTVKQAASGDKVGETPHIHRLAATLHELAQSITTALGELNAATDGANAATAPSAPATPAPAKAA